MSFSNHDFKQGKPGPGYLARVTITNKGIRAGAEVVQLYVHDEHSKIDRPIHELKAFKYVELKPGESNVFASLVISSHSNIGILRRGNGPSTPAPSKSRSGIPPATSVLRLRFKPAADKLTSDAA